MKPAVLTLLMLVLAPAALPAARHGYDMEIPAAGVPGIRAYLRTFPEQLWQRFERLDDAVVPSLFVLPKGVPPR